MGTGVANENKLQKCSNKAEFKIYITGNYMVYIANMAIHSDNKFAECSYLFTTNSETDI